MLRVIVPSLPKTNEYWTIRSPFYPDSKMTFEPRTSTGGRIPSVILEARHPDETRPVNTRELDGEKGVTHAKYNADLTYDWSSKITMNTRRSRSGSYGSTTLIKHDFYTSYQRYMWDKHFIRDGETLISLVISGSVSMVTDKVTVRGATITSYRLLDSLPSNNGETYYNVDVQRDTRTITVSGGNFTDYKVKDLEDRFTSIDAIIDWLQEWTWVSDTTESRTVRHTVYYLTAASTLPVSSTAAEAMRLVKFILSKGPSYAGLPEMKDFGTLAGEAAASADANSANMIAFVRDLKDIKSLVPKLRNLGSLKTHANNYLAVNYGILPTVGDLEAIRDSLHKEHWTDSFGNQILTSGYSAEATYDLTSVKSTRRMKLTVSNEDSRFSSLVRKMRSSGFYPSAQNLWDLVPYSFVLDWFIDIGDVLERFDSGIRLGELPIKSCTYSQKDRYDLSPLVLSMLPDFKGTVTLTRYNRYVKRRPPKPPLTFNSEITAQNHLIEGSALILTRSREN